MGGVRINAFVFLGLAILLFVLLPFNCQSYSSDDLKPPPNPKTLAQNPETLPKPETPLKPKLPKPSSLNPKPSNSNHTILVLYYYCTTKIVLLHFVLLYDHSIVEGSVGWREKSSKRKDFNGGNYLGVTRAWFRAFGSRHIG